MVRIVKVRIEDEEGNCSQSSFVLTQDNYNNKKFMKGVADAAAKTWNGFEKVMKENQIESTH